MQEEGMGGKGSEVRDHGDRRAIHDQLYRVWRQSLVFQRLLDQHAAVLLEEIQRQDGVLAWISAPSCSAICADRLARLGLGDDPLVVLPRGGDRAGEIGADVVRRRGSTPLWLRQSTSASSAASRSIEPMYCAVVGEVARPPGSVARHVDSRWRRR